MRNESTLSDIFFTKEEGKLLGELLESFIEETGFMDICIFIRGVRQWEILNGFSQDGHSLDELEYKIYDFDLKVLKDIEVEKTKFLQDVVNQKHNIVTRVSQSVFVISSKKKIDSGQIDIEEMMKIDKLRVDIKNITKDQFI